MIWKWFSLGKGHFKGPYQMLEKSMLVVNNGELYKATCHFYTWKYWGILKKVLIYHVYYEVKYIFIHTMTKL